MSKLTCDKNSELINRRIHASSKRENKRKKSRTQRSKANVSFHYIPPRPRVKIPMQGPKSTTVPGPSFEGHEFSFEPSLHNAKIPSSESYPNLSENPTLEDIPVTLIPCHFGRNGFVLTVLQSELTERDIFWNESMQTFTVINEAGSILQTNDQTLKYASFIHGLKFKLGNDAFLLAVHVMNDYQLSPSEDAKLCAMRRLLSIIANHKILVPKFRELLPSSMNVFNVRGGCGAVLWAEDMIHCEFHPDPDIQNDLRELYRSRL